MNDDQDDQPSDGRVAGCNVWIGGSVGFCVGDNVGFCVGEDVGLCVVCTGGFCVGFMVGFGVGGFGVRYCVVGRLVVFWVGWEVEIGCWIFIVVGKGGVNLVVGLVGSGGVSLVVGFVGRGVVVGFDVVGWLGFGISVKQINFTETVNDKSKIILECKLCIFLTNHVSLLLNSKWEIHQIYHGENNLHFDEMIMISVLC